MKKNAAPTPLAPLGAVALALCLVIGALLVSPAANARTTQEPAATSVNGSPRAISQHLPLVARAVTVLATGDRRPLRVAQNERPRVSLDDAVSKVRSRYKGRVIRAETRYAQDGRPTHYVKLLSQDGRVRTIRVDGRTGRIR